MATNIIQSILERMRFYIVKYGRQPRNVYLGRIDMDMFLAAYKEQTGFMPNTRHGLEFEGLYIFEVNIETHLGVGE